jgi:hypothetical protein
MNFINGKDLDTLLTQDQIDLELQPILNSISTLDTGLQGALSSISQLAEDAITSIMTAAGALPKEDNSVTIPNYAPSAETQNLTTGVQYPLTRCVIHFGGYVPSAILTGYYAPTGGSYTSFMGISYAGSNGTYTIAGMGISGQTIYDTSAGARAFDLTASTGSLTCRLVGTVIDFSTLQIEWIPSEGQTLSITIATSDAVHMIKIYEANSVPGLLTEELAETLGQVKDIQTSAGSILNEETGVAVVPDFAFPSKIENPVAGSQEAYVWRLRLDAVAMISTWGGFNYLYSGSSSQTSVGAIQRTGVAQYSIVGMGFNQTNFFVDGVITDFDIVITSGPNSSTYTDVTGRKTSDNTIDITFTPRGPGDRFFLNPSAEALPLSELFLDSGVSPGLFTDAARKQITEEILDAADTEFVPEQLLSNEINLRASSTTAYPGNTLRLKDFAMVNFSGGQPTLATVNFPGVGQPIYLVAFAQSQNSQQLQIQPGGLTIRQADGTWVPGTYSYATSGYGTNNAVIYQDANGDWCIECSNTMTGIKNTQIKPASLSTTYNFSGVIEAVELAQETVPGIMTQPVWETKADQSALNDANAEIEVLGQRMTTAEGNISTNATNIETNATDISSLQTEVGGILTSYSALNTRLSRLETSFGEYSELAAFYERLLGSLRASSGITLIPDETNRTIAIKALVAGETSWKLSIAVGAVSGITGEYTAVVLNQISNIPSYRTLNTNDAAMTAEFTLVEGVDYSLGFEKLGYTADYRNTFNLTADAAESITSLAFAEADLQFTFDDSIEGSVSTGNMGYSNAGYPRDNINIYADGVKIQENYTGGGSFNITPGATLQMTIEPYAMGSEDWLKNWEPATGGWPPKQKEKITQCQFLPISDHTTPFIFFKNCVNFPQDFTVPFVEVVAVSTKYSVLSGAFSGTLFRDEPGKRALFTDGTEVVPGVGGVPADVYG